MEYCFTCGNYGFPDRECPECGRRPKSLNLSKLEPEDIEQFSREVKSVKIPEPYVGNEWSSIKFWRNHSDKLGSEGKPKDKLLEHFVNTLEKVHNIFASGEVPKKSAIVVAPSTYSKLTWAFSCMQHAIKSKRTVAPFLDTLEAHRLVVLSSQDPKYKLYGSIDYDSYITSEVLFLTVTKTEYRKHAYSLIQDIFDKRTRLGLSTFVVSRYSIEELARWDRSGNFIKIKEESPDENNMKTPVILTYKEAFT